ncbi:MAG: LysM peptidoglycan-binding domain-containing protein [Simkaniaceae bacterium]
MNRKDIIITAVLINAGLLIVLFISSLKPRDFDESVQKKKIEKVTHQAQIKAPPPPILEQKSVDQQIAKAAKKIEKSPSKIVQPLREEKKVPTLVLVEVMQGDNLEKIAKSYEVSVESLMNENQLSTTRLQIGQKLKIPAQKNRPKEEIQKLEKHEYYTVKNGDNPWTIAVKNQIKVDELLKLNGLDENKARRLKPGDRLKIK